MPANRAGGLVFNFELFAREAGGPIRTTIALKSYTHPRQLEGGISEKVETIVTDRISALTRSRVSGHLPAWSAIGRMRATNPPWGAVKSVPDVVTLILATVAGALDAIASSS